MKLRPLLLIAATFLISLCSLSYELILSQILAATLGGTLLRYSTVIGLFTLSLGLGSLSYGFFKERVSNRVSLLFYVEVFLALLGMASPFVVVGLEPLRPSGDVGFAFTLLYYIPVMMIGWISGLELPLLLSLGENRRRELQILSADYLGMFAGSLLIPLVWYSAFGPFAGSLWLALINLVGAALLLPFFTRENLKLKKRLSILASLTGLVLIVNLNQEIWIKQVRTWFLL